MNKLLHNDLLMFNKNLHPKTLLKLNKQCIFFVDGSLYYDFPVGINNDKELNQVKYFKILNTIFTQCAKIVPTNINNLENLEYLELSYPYLYETQMDTLEKLRTLVISNTKLNELKITNTLPFNLENIILLVDIPSIKRLAFPIIKLDNLPINLKRIIFYTKCKTHLELKTYIIENSPYMKIPFGCKLYTDNEEIIV